MIFRGMIVAAMLATSSLTFAAEGGKTATQPAPGDWPHWAGPNFNCTSSEKGLLKTWPAEGPKVLWKTSVGVGSNHPAVAGDDVVFAQSDAGWQTESVVCLDLNTGKLKWKYSYPCVYPGGVGVDNSNMVGWGKLGARATPVLTDKHACSVGTLGHMVCIDRKTGKLAWKIDLKEGSPAFSDGKGGMRGPFQIGEWKGFNQSPAAAGGKIIYAPHGAEPLLVAYDEDSGKVVWKYEEACEKGVHNWGIMQTSITKFHNEECCLIQYNQSWKLIRVSDGKQVWCKRVTQGDRGGNWTIVPLTGKYFYDAFDGIFPGTVECDFSLDDPTPKQLWGSIEVNDNEVPPVCWNGYYYGFGYDVRSDSWGKGDKPQQTLSLRCTDMMTGKLMWKTKPDFTSGMSISAADGMLYVHSFQKLTLVQANPEAYTEKGRVDNLHNAVYANGKKGYFGNVEALVDWDMPVISHGRLLIRTPVEIICYDIADRSAGNNPRKQREEKK